MEQAGTAVQYFISDDEEDAEEDPTHPSNQNTWVDEEEQIETNIFSALNHVEDIAIVQGMGLDVDNNNEQSPENIPKEVSRPTTTVQTNYTHEEVGWGWPSIDHQESLNIQDQ